MTKTYCPHCGESLRVKGAPGLTARQAECLAFIQAYSEAHDGLMPNYREIGSALGITSTSQVHGIMHALRRRGHIGFEDGCARSSFITGAA